uniref:Uncharacterized protein n=1 Tax=Mustela putorius furo TaxID=9669 RepID=M3Y5Q8_MUSPF
MEEKPRGLRGQKRHRDQEVYTMLSVYLQDGDRVGGGSAERRPLPGLPPSSHGHPRPRFRRGHGQPALRPDAGPDAAPQRQLAAAGQAPAHVLPQEVASRNLLQRSARWLQASSGHEEGGLRELPSASAGPPW